MEVSEKLKEAILSVDEDSLKFTYMKLILDLSARLSKVEEVIAQLMTEERDGRAEKTPEV